MTIPLIESNPAIMMSKPVVAGTRITVEFILEKLAAGETIEQLLSEHPRLRREHILAALDFRRPRPTRRHHLSYARQSGMRRQVSM